MRLWVLFWATGVGLGGSAAVPAQEPVGPQSHGAVTVFVRKQLQNLPYITLEQLLRHDVSLQMASQSLQGRQSFPAVRGAGRAFGSGIILRVNGQRISDDFYGSPFVFARYFPVAHIRRLTIYRGTAASWLASDATDAVIDIVTLDGPSEAGLLLGQCGFTNVSIQRGARALVALQDDQLRLQLWTHNFEDEGFRQQIQDASGHTITTIDPLAAHSFGASLSSGIFFSHFYGSYYSSRRGLVYGYKSHTNRARHSYLSLQAGVEGQLIGTTTRVTLQLSQGKANALGLLVPAGIRPQTTETPLEEDYLFNEWANQYGIGLRGRTEFELWQHFNVGLRLDATWSLVGRAEQKGTHDPDTFEFANGVGNHATNIPALSHRQRLAAAVFFGYRNASFTGTLLGGIVFGNDVGFVNAENTGVQPLLGLTLKWNYWQTSYTWAAVSRTVHTPPWMVQYLENHPLFDPDIGQDGKNDVRTDTPLMGEIGVKQDLGSLLHTTLVLFIQSATFLQYVPIEDVPIEDVPMEGHTQPCPPDTCLLVRRFRNRFHDWPTGLEWTLSGRFGFLSIDAYGMFVFRMRQKTKPDFSRLHGGVRATSQLGNHDIGLAASLFGKFTRDGAYPIIDIRWGYRFAPWGRVLLTASNLSDSRAGGVARTMPNGYPSRGTTFMAELEIRDVEGLLPLSGPR